MCAGRGSVALNFAIPHFAQPLPGEDDGEEGGVSVEGATRRLLSQLARKNIVENVVPVLLSLKRQLGTSRVAERGRG